MVKIHALGNLVSFFWKIFMNKSFIRKKERKDGRQPVPPFNALLSCHPKVSWLTFCVAVLGQAACCVVHTAASPPPKKKTNKHYSSSSVTDEETIYYTKYLAQGRLADKRLSRNSNARDPPT